MKPSDIISEARYIFQDRSDGLVSPRQTDAELLLYVNGALKEISALKPAMFATIAPLVCVAGAKQAITFVNALTLLDVLNITNGPSLTQFDYKALDQFKPGWRQDAAAAAQQWSPLESDPLAFYTYPPSLNGQSLDVRYVRNATEYTLSEDITDVPAALKPALVDYVVYRAESKDDENVLSARSNGHYQSFLNKIGAG